MLDRLYDSNLIVLYIATFILIAGAAGIGAWIGRQPREAAKGGADFGTLAGAALGLLALLLGFSFSLALSRYEVRRSLVLEEANAIGSTANPPRLSLPGITVMVEWESTAKVMESRAPEQSPRGT